MPVNQPEARRLLARLHEAQNIFYRGGADSAVLRDLLTDDITWHVPGRNAISGEHRGIDAVVDYFARRRDLAARTLGLTTREILTGDDWIAAVTDGHAVVDGKDVDWSTVGLYRVRQERVAECRLLPFDVEAFDAIWAARPGPGHEATVPVRPRYCDAQGMVHASRYYEFFEDAFLGWLDEHVGGYGRLRAAGTDLVVVASSCDHALPARLDDRLAVEVRPIRAGRTSLTMSFTIRRHAATIVTGRTTYVAVATDGRGAVPLPGPLVTALPAARSAARPSPATEPARGGRM
jgi:YbgC/YbaW family acyl-CoA thioester hydrolase